MTHVIHGGVAQGRTTFSSKPIHAANPSKHTGPGAGLDTIRKLLFLMWEKVTGRSMITCEKNMGNHGNMLNIWQKNQVAACQSGCYAFFPQPPVQTLLQLALFNDFDARMLEVETLLREAGWEQTRTI